MGVRIVLAGLSLALSVFGAGYLSPVRADTITVIGTVSIAGVNGAPPTNGGPGGNAQGGRRTNTDLSTRNHQKVAEARVWRLK
jgi:hypothetical protein